MTDEEQRKFRTAVRNNQIDAQAPAGDTRYDLRKSRNTWRVVAITLAAMLAVQSYNILTGAI